MLPVQVRERFLVASRWVWALIALALLWMLFVLLSSPAAISLPNLYGAFVTATPALFAAALMYVAPQDRHIRLAALCFAVPIAVNLIIGAGILLAGRTLSTDYEYLAPRLASVGDAFTLIGWAFPIVAVFLVGAYIGPVLTRRGWLVVGAAAVGWLLNAALIVASQPEYAAVDRTLIALVAQSVWVAWGYLLAVAIERRMFLVALASGAYLVSSLVNLVAFTFLLREFDDPGAPAVQAILVTIWLLGVVSWAALIAGILRELPRFEPDVPARRGTHQALSPTR